MTIDAVIKKTNAHYYLECEICTGSCPISRINPNYSPRLFVEKALLISEQELIEDDDLWTCLTCGACSARCPSLVDYNDFMFQMRQLAYTSLMNLQRPLKKPGQRISLTKDMITEVDMASSSRTLRKPVP